ncbi:hypothetical protein CPB83DRAFT_863013 [Crepidotus variabilis]|uniref:Uncharacterized protein n=1 Tax=Crepidotus variabilis TaxID=179855 RepID=A0A9P6E6D9_9AGAR|nr:hypothetical protein CPB83DRAFT_863013 [Crepidotus variabilis]
MGSSSLSQSSSSAVGDRLSSVLLGLYFWEWITSLGFEWDLITRKRPLRWPMFFYLGNRYLLWGHLIDLQLLWIVRGHDHPIDCRVAFALSHLLGKGALAFASMNLAIRTIAIWERNIYVIASLSLVMMANIAMIFAVAQESIKTSRWDTEAMACTTRVNNDWMRIIFLLYMLFDLLVLTLNLQKLGKEIKGRQLRKNLSPAWDRSKKTTGSERSFMRLTYLVFEQGIVYFFIAVCANAAALFIVSIPPPNSNVPLKSFTLPIYVASTIVACRAVRGLMTFQNNVTDIHVSTSTHLTV